MGYIIGLLGCHCGDSFDEFRRWGFVGGRVASDKLVLFRMGEVWSIIQGRFRSRLSTTVEGT